MTRVRSFSREETLTMRESLVRSAFSGELRWSEAVLQIRLSVGKTQDEFGKLFGLSRRQVSALERGTCNPTVQTLSKLGKPFGLVIGFVPRKGMAPPHERD
jgi:transcriptional regulator with XRE-family HTH domain